MNRYQVALDNIGNYADGISEHIPSDCHNIETIMENLDVLQELIDKCAFISEEWKTKNNVQDTFLIETPTDRNCLPQGVDYD